MDPARLSPAAEPVLFAAPRWRRFAVDLYLTIRVSTLGFTLLLPLLGSAAAVPGWRPAEAAWLAAIALAFHVFAYVFNDVVDLRVDRTEPLRADSPLVRGAISRAQALALAWAMPPIAFLIAWAGDASAAMLVGLALAFCAMGVYDLFGKRCRWPLATDAIQSAGWVALLGVGACAANQGWPVTSALAWLAGYVFVCVMLVNGVHGALRDLANDRRHGARTTAISFGAQERPDGTARPSPALVAYACALQVALVGCALGAWQALAPASQRLPALAPVAAALTAAGVSFGIAFGRRGRRRALVAAGAWNIVATLLVLPALVWPAVGPVGGTALLIVFGLPVLAMWAYNGSHWHIEPRPRGERARLSLHATLRLMRIEKPLVAAAFTFLGAWLAAPLQALWSRPVLIAATSVGCIAGFGFVINDLYDQRVDAIGKPMRPLPAGEVPVRTAQRLAGALATLGIALGLLLGALPGAIAAAAVAMSALYSCRLKSTLLLGNASVALIVSTVLVYGAVVTGGVPPAVWMAAAVTASYILAQEALFTLEDEAEDRAAGLTTTATLLGIDRAAELVRALLLVFAAVGLAPWLAGAAGEAYAAAFFAVALAPAAVAWWWLRGPVDRRRISRAVRLSRLVWVTSFLPLALLK
jgi:4-hydroxybenzoate polyprenyltransferase